MTLIKKNWFLTIFLCLFFFTGIFGIPLFTIKSTVSGKVIEEETGNGIPGVTINIFYGESRDICVTDKKGEFIIFEVETGELSIAFVPPPPYAMPLMSERFDYFTLKTGKNLHIIKKIEYGGIIRGKVYDKNSIVPLIIENLWIFNHIPETVKINDNGEYKIEQIKPGNHTLKLCVIGYGPREVKNIEINKRETITIDFPYDSQSSTKIIGKIDCEQLNNSYGNLRVNLYSEINNLYSKTYTNNNGDFNFKDLIPGEYLILVAGVNKIDSSPNLIQFKKLLKLIKGKTSFVKLKVDCSLDYLVFGNVI